MPGGSPVPSADGEARNAFELRQRVLELAEEYDRRAERVKLRWVADAA
jgi:hypothetical protein